jgi:porphobilinogen synthase
MPGISRYSISNLVEEAGAVASAGIGTVILFGIPAAKDEVGSGAYDDEGIVQMAVRALKEEHPALTVITDVCLCEYTSHGHCGVFREGSREVDNDLSVELLAKTAISHADAGADAVAPSDMMDGRVGSIRFQLDEEGHPDVPIIAYSAKYASSFYEPFRVAAGSTP